MRQAVATPISPSSAMQRRWVALSTRIARRNGSIFSVSVASMPRCSASDQ